MEAVEAAHMQDASLIDSGPAFPAIVSTGIFQIRLPDQPVDFIAEREQMFGEVIAVLPGDAGDERSLHVPIGLRGCRRDVEKTGGLAVAEVDCNHEWTRRNTTRDLCKTPRMARMGTDERTVL